MALVTCGGGAQSVVLLTQLHVHLGWSTSITPFLRTSQALQDGGILLPLGTWKTDAGHMPVGALLALQEHGISIFSVVEVVPGNCYN